MKKKIIVKNSLINPKIWEDKIKSKKITKKNNDKKKKKNGKKRKKMLSS